MTARAASGWHCACAPRLPSTARDFWANLGRWDMVVTAYEGDRWRDAGADSANRARGPMDRFQLAPSADGVSGRVDQRQPPLSGRVAGSRTCGYNEHRFHAYHGDAAPPAPVLMAFSEPPANAAFIHPHEAADVRQIRGYRSANRRCELRILRGDFHRHTEISPDGAGDGSLEDYFRYMMDAASMDTGIVSDHNAGGEEYTWWRTEKAIDLFHIPGGLHAAVRLRAQRALSQRTSQRGVRAARRTRAAHLARGKAGNASTPGRCFTRT